MIELTVITSQREEFIDITSKLANLVQEAKASDGYLFCYVPHTTAAITINEAADPDVSRDIIHKLRDLIPRQGDYHHAEGNSDAHLKSSLIGCSLQIPFENMQLLMGTWQGVYFCEFDGPRTRRLQIRICSFG